MSVGADELRVFDAQGLIRYLGDAARSSTMSVTLQGNAPSSVKLTRIDAAQGELIGQMISPLEFFFFEVPAGTWRVEVISDQGEVRLVKVAVGEANSSSGSSTEMGSLAAE